MPIGDLLQRLQVLNGDEVWSRVAVVDGAEHSLDGLAFTLGHRELLELLGLGNLLDGLSLTLSLENPRRLDAFGLEDLRALVALGLGDQGTTIAAPPSSGGAWRP